MGEMNRENNLTKKGTEGGRWGNTFFLLSILSRCFYANLFPAGMSLHLVWFISVVPALFGWLRMDDGLADG